MASILLTINGDSIFNMNIFIQLVLKADEHSGNIGFWDELWSITLDPAHIVAELIFTAIFDGLIITVAYNLIFKKFILPKLRRDIHKDIDDAHGEVHDKAHS